MTDLGNERNLKQIEPVLEEVLSLLGRQNCVYKVRNTMRYKEERANQEDFLEEIVIDWGPGLG